MAFRNISTITVIGLTMLAATPAAATLSEDFDGGGTTPYTLTQLGSGTGPSLVAGGPSGTFVRLANLSGSNNNSIAFDEEPTQTGPSPTGLVLSFDFRMTDDATNAAAGGCCGSAADGLGIGLFDTSVHGTTGSFVSVGAVWERPSFSDAFTVGLDIFQNIDVVNLNWAGVEVASMDVGTGGLNLMDLNDNLFHRAIVTLTPNGGSATVNMDIIEDVFGVASTHSVFVNQAVAGMDLTSLFDYRVVAGGRTGGAYTNGDMDNISVASVSTSVPSPAPLVLVMLGLAGIGYQRRKRN